MESNAREIVLGRVRESLATLDKELTPRPELSAGVVRQLKGSTLEERIDFFTAKVEELGDVIYRCESAESAVKVIVEIASKLEDVKSIEFDQDAIELIGLSAESKIESLPISVMSSHKEPFESIVGVAIADLGVAETGTVIISAQKEISRLTTLLPPVSIILLTTDRILEDLADAVVKQPASDSTSMVAWITGSSRTADIDGVLIRGAHGPKELHVILTDNK